jgi:small-conductance mechanosensitive channel
MKLFERLLEQAWKSNDALEWLIGIAVVLGVLLAMAALRYVLTRVFKALASKKGIVVVELADELARATRLWLLLPVALYAGAVALDLPPRLERLAGVLALAAVLAQAAVWANRAIDVWLRHRLTRQGAAGGDAVTALSLIGFTARVLVWLITVLLVLDQFGFNITALVAGLGIGGIAVALAVQNVLGDLFASLSIVLDKPFVVGDAIAVDNLNGTVERIGIKSTRIRSLDGDLLVFSNNDLLKSRIRNYKRMMERRVSFTIAVVYRTPLEKLRSIPQMLREAIESRPKTRFERAHFKEFSDAALVFEVVYHVLTPDNNHYLDVQQDINLSVYDRFTRSGIELAHRALIMQPAPSAGGMKLERIG